jgi:hypothetical protein
MRRGTIVITTFKALFRVFMPRYVILLHEIPPGREVAGGRGTHWDLMLEQDGVLRTWALAAEPRADLAIQAEQLPAHRIEYLDYEGPVSGNRGNVRRCDAGEFQLLAETPDRIEIQLAGRTAARNLNLILTRAPGADAHFWIASFAFAPTRGSSSPGDSSSSSS